MKKIIIAAVLVLGSSLSPALAWQRYDLTFHDTLRPGGHQRSLATAKAAPTQAFKDCMNTQGFRWLSTKLVHSAPTRQATSAIPKGHFIDQDTGLLCHNTGGASICESPPANMTIRYTSESGLNCTRTGIASVCSSF
jgi:hypothetical protein